MKTYEITNETIAKLEAAGFNRWTKNGMDRLYIDADKLGLEVTRYNNGKAKEGTWQGAEMYKQELQEIDASKIYIDLADGTLHAKTDFVPSYASDPTVESVAEAYADSILVTDTDEDETETETKVAETETTDRAEMVEHVIAMMYGSEGPTREVVDWYDSQRDSKSLSVWETSAIHMAMADPYDNDAAHLTALNVADIQPVLYRAYNVEPSIIDQEVRSELLDELRILRDWTRAFNALDDDFEDVTSSAVMLEMLTVC